MPCRWSTESIQMYAALRLLSWFLGSMDAKRQNSSNVMTWSQFLSSSRIILRASTASAFMPMLLRAVSRLASVMQPVLSGSSSANACQHCSAESWMCLLYSVYERTPSWRLFAYFFRTSLQCALCHRMLVKPVHSST
jgi:hypothetical protein